MVGRPAGTGAQRTDGAGALDCAPLSDPSAHDLGETALTSARWIFLARVVVEALLLGSTVTLAHLLSPASFGRAAIALIFTTLASTLIAGVAGPLLIQRPTLSDAHRQASAWLGISLGLVCSLATLLAAPLLAGPLFGKQTSSLVQLASPAFLLVGLAVTPQSMLQRRLAFRRLSEIEIVAATLGALASIILAIAGLGASAIVLGTLIGLGASTLGVLVSVTLVLPHWHRRELGELTRFGVPVAMGSLSTLIYSNIDYAILGARLGAGTVGLYWRAYQLGVEYQGKVSIVMLRLAFPVYSRSDDLDHLRRMRRRIQRTHATVIFPLLATLIAVAPVLIPFVYGSAWRVAVLPTQILATVGMMAAVLTGIGPLIYAIGKPMRGTIMNWISVVVYATTIYFVAPYGVIAVSIADACLLFAVLLASQYWLASKQVGIPLRSLWGDVGPALAASAALVIVAGPLAGVLQHAHVTAPLILLTVAAVGLPLYLGLIRSLSRGAWEDVKLLSSRIVGRRPQPVVNAA